LKKAIFTSDAARKCCGLVTLNNHKIKASITTIKLPAKQATNKKFLLQLQESLQQTVCKGFDIAAVLVT
jgi:hypothetical protein